MDNKWMKRLVSLSVALEMLLSPVAVARAEEVVSERPETPALTGQEGAQTPAVDSASVVSAPAQAGSAAAPSASTSDLFALPVGVDFAADMSFGIPLDSTGTYPARYDGYFKWEGGTERTWGYRAHNASVYKYFNQKDGNFYTVLPRTGRLPDLELEGFYLLGEAPNESWLDGYSADANKVKSWVYDETWTDPVRLEESKENVPFSSGDDVDYPKDYTTLAYLTQAQMEAAIAANIVQSDGTIYYAPIVARWVTSGKNNITYLSATTRQEGAAAGEETAWGQFFTEDPTGKHAPETFELAGIDATTFDGVTSREFWLRVPEDQESLSLKFEAFEPYYTYNVERNGAGNSPVSVRVLFNGEEVAGKDGESISVTRGWAAGADGTGGSEPIFPMPLEMAGGYYHPRNTADAPARSRWSVTDIPLAKVAQATGEDSRTTVILTVDAPNGARATYTIHVERLMTPEYKLGYGNTPVAMIEKDQGGNWGDTAALVRSNKDAAKADFVKYYRLGQSGIVAPGSYVYYKSLFDPSAWRGLTWEGNSDYNIDLDETAVVAYQDTAFADPGVTFIGSNGKPVSFGATATEDYRTCVTRSIQLKTADKLTVDLYGNGGVECWYTADGTGKGALTTDESRKTQILQNADGSDGVDLRGLNVLPGVYTMTYTFTDPLDPTEPVVAKRPLVVLPIPGDVDMDGAVTVADALTLSTHWADWESSAASDVQLLRYRVLGEVGEEKILSGFQPVLANLGRSDYFYPLMPTPKNASDTYQRKTWGEVEMNGSAKLELRYLGLEPGILMGKEGYTVPATDGVMDTATGQLGPWQANSAGEVTIRELDSAGNEKYGVYQGDVFWVGVYLTAGELAHCTLEDLTVTLTYDSDYVQPAVVYQYEQFGSDETQQQRWLSALYYYNFGAGSRLDQTGQTLFSGYGTGDYTYRSGTSWSRSYATHYSKVIGELERLQASTSLREMVVSIQSTATGNRVSLPGGEEAVCVLTVPFQLIRHPAAGRLADGKARLVELGAGMRDFNLVTRPSTKLSAATLFDGLSATLLGVQPRTIAQGDTTYAFSAQDDIYGGATQNLREKVSYLDDDGAMPGLIPIGENKSSAIQLPGAKYAQSYSVRGLPVGAITQGSLPAGLNYSTAAGTEGIISGTPIEVGEGVFNFTITRNATEYLYTLTVEKRTLRFSPVGCGAHYGQSEYRGESNPQFHFTYRVSDLAQRDVPDGVTLTGEGDELDTILLGEEDTQYTKPTFTAKLSRDSTAEAVRINTNVGVYPIVLDDGTALDDKYDLVLDTTTLSSQIMEIYRRPVWIDHITADAEATGAQIYSDGDRLDCIITLTETDPDQPMLHLAFSSEVEASGTYAGRPLTGDARVAGDTLILTFAGEYQRNEDDIENFPNNQDMFYMTSGAMTRSIGKVTVSDTYRRNFDEKNPNYTLQLSGNGVLNSGANDILGAVLRRELTSLEMSDYPVALRAGGSVTYGENLSLSDLRIRVTRNNQELGSQPYDFTYDFNGALAQAMDIHYNWVTEEEMKLGLQKGNEDTIVGSGWDPSKPKDEQDSMPYKDTNSYLSVGMDGYYLCAIARKYEENDPNADPNLGRHAYVKYYSEYPLRVNPKEITLTLRNLTRFYGEESAQPKYTYSVNELSTVDLNKLHQIYGPDYTLTGDSSELEAVLGEGYTKPTIQFMQTPSIPQNDTDSGIVTVDTDVTGTSYYVVMYGARSLNYTFRYDRVDTEGRRPSRDFGTAYLSIMKRPIVVEDVWSMYATGDDHKDTFATIYADSRNLLLTDQVDNGAHTAFTASAASDAAYRVTFTTPSFDPDAQSVTYYAGGNSNAVTQRGMAYSGDAVRPQDAKDLGVRYNVQFLPDQEHFSWNTFSQNYYNVEDLTASGGQAQRPVELRDLQLTGAKADNYMLVYNNSFQAVQRAPANAELYNAPKATSSADVGNVAYMAYGTGLVILRPIKTMDIRAVGDMSYTYGEYFAPDNVGVSGSQFTLSVNYDTRFDNYPAAYVGDPHHNVSSESVVYTYESDTSSFEKRGFVIHYIDSATQKKEDVATAGDQVLMGGAALYPAVHDGKHLFVSGKRGETDALVCSSVTSSVLEVKPAALTLTARDVHRYYGEDNHNGYVVQERFDPEDNVKPFTFTIPASQLARWDRERIGSLLGVTIASTDTLTQTQLEEALSLAARSDDPEEVDWAVGFGYQKPRIETEAGKASPINTSHGQWGEYEITNTAKPFANYSVTGVGAKLYIYPRPIRITAMASSEENPVYTVFNKTDGTIFNTSFSQSRVTVERSNAVAGTEGWARSLANSTAVAQLKLSGDALVGEDKLVYKGQVQYLESVVLPEGETDAWMEVVATVTGLGSSPNEAEKNYDLSRPAGGDPFVDDKAIGAVKLRTIGYILIESPPKKDYTYGETLDLSGLRVRVVYMMLGDETSVAERISVDYEDPNQFQSYGLYVNYWDPAHDTIPDDWKSVPSAYRKAATGDHLTIAPTHDTQRYLGNDMSKPLQRPFAANGAGLIVTGYQEGGNQSAAQPKIVAARSVHIDEAGFDSYEVTAENNAPFRLSVQPLRLNYTILATDKTYNGDVRTAGTLRLTNLFDRTNVQLYISANAGSTIQSPVRGQVTDVVYVPVGAAYEGVSDPDRYDSYDAQSGYRVTNGAISFTTGSFTPAPGDLMTQNAAVSWEPGYQWGKGLLEFTFPNANVHYIDDAFASGTPGVGTADLAQYWRASQDLNTPDSRWDAYPDVSQMPVEVSNMRFLGPDAANYTWAPSDQPQTTQTDLTLDSNPADLGANQASLPYATIHKANRQPIQDLLRTKGFVLPTLQVDDRTNVIRLTYEEDLKRVDDLTHAAQEAQKVLNDAGVDDYRDELHFEYALVYRDADGLVRQWAGKEGEDLYQDTVFFGGEAVAPVIDPAYVPNLDDLDKEAEADENTVYKGQLYRWDEEDGGFAVDPSAYPGYATYGESVRQAYWYYTLYATDRAPLPRNTVFYPLVRLSETHNYNPSGDLIGDGDGDNREDVSAQSLYDARQAVTAYLQGQGADEAETLLAQAAERSEQIFAESQSMTRAALDQANARVEADAAMARDDFPETPPDQSDPLCAVKTYHQRLDLLSASWEDDPAGGWEYLVRILEDVRFTDTLLYPEQELMDAVVYNNPTRYYGYAWDPDMTAEAAFGDEEQIFDLDSVMTFEIQEHQPNGEDVDVVWTYDPRQTNYTAQLYVKFTHGGRTVRTIKIIPSALSVRVGDKPVQLRVDTDPKMPSNRYYIWTSSDASVVTVDENGLVTIRGEGLAVITVTTTNGRKNSIPVVVGPALAPEQQGGEDVPLFNRYYTGSWADLDDDYAFRPKDTMTRSEVVELLDLLLNPELDLAGTRELAYVDVTGKERYYGALARLTHVGVVKGVPGSAFAGERLTTRAEFVTMLARMLRLNTPDTVGLAHAFADSGEDATWAYAYIDAMAKAGVILGTGGGNFAPSRPITREEAAAIIARLLVTRLDPEADNLRVPSDMTPENWSYPAVLRAVNSVVGAGF